MKPVLRKYVAIFAAAYAVLFLPLGFLFWDDDTFINTIPVALAATFLYWLYLDN